MHRVAKAHLEDFATKYDVYDKEAKQFETFLNYVIFRTHCAENVDPRDLVYDGDDPGIDGVMIFIDDAYVSSVDEVEEAMKHGCHHRVHAGQDIGIMVEGRDQRFRVSD
jgi:hypothetical protein